ncbi:MAG: enoyl-CoA hydratase/isomerase family protein [Acidimicrobiia bacterium]
MSVQTQTSGGVTEIVLDRPDRINAVDEAMVERLHEALGAAEAAGARALLVRGEGKGFCAGRDLSDAQPGTEDAEAILAKVFNPLFVRLARFPAPTFAAVHGAALGVGLGLALACDVVYAAESAKVGSPFARIGAVLDSGGHGYLVRRLGAHRALELIYTGRLLSGTEAAQWGLVNAAVPADDLVEVVRGLARTAAAGPTAAFRLSKELVARVDTGALTLEDVLSAEAGAQGEASRTRDYAEGIGAFQEKRTPTFTGE